MRNQSDDGVPTLLSSGETQDRPGPATARTTRPRQDRGALDGATRRGPQGDRAPELASSNVTTRTTDSGVQQAATPQQVPPTGTQPPTIDLPPIEGAPEVQVPNLTPGPLDRPPDIQPLPGVDGDVTVPACCPDQGRVGPDGRPLPEPPVMPFMPGSQRLTRIFPRNGHSLDMHKLDTSPEGVDIYIVRNGINIVTQAPRFGTIDIEADSAIIWHGPSPTKGEPYKSPQGDLFVEDAKAPMEIYLEGNVILRQDENKYAGRGDQRTVRAPQLYYDFLTDRMLAPNGEIDMFTPTALLGARETIVTARSSNFGRRCSCQTGR